MRWRRQHESDQWGRRGLVYLSGCDQWKISDEGPAPWTLLKRDNGTYRFHSEHLSLTAAKARARTAP